MRKEEMNPEADRTPETVSAEEASKILADLSAEIEAAKREAKEYKESYLRARADYDNLRKRSERDADEAARRGKAAFMLKALDIMDDLERAAGSGAKGDDLQKGIVLTIKKLSDALSSEGLEPIEAIGQPFNPEFHEAVAAVEADVAFETVCDELRRGYSYCGSTLRPSVVRVSVPRKH